MGSILLNSVLAAANLSGGRRRARECMGGPLVGMKYSTPCLVDEQMKLGVVVSRNCPRSVVYSLLGRVWASRRDRQSVVAGDSRVETKVVALTSLLPLTSTERALESRKLAPNRAHDTSAIKNFHL